jgi:hypothetical protein
MATKKHNTIVISLSAAIAVSIVLLQWKSRQPLPYEFRVYSIANGWAYDILVNDSLFIHQESIPALEGNKPFLRESQAREAARTVISKLERRQSPSFSRSEIERICLSQ